MVQCPEHFCRACRLTKSHLAFLQKPNICVRILLSSLLLGYPDQFRSPLHTLVQYVSHGQPPTSGKLRAGDGLNIQAVGCMTMAEPADVFGESGILC